MFEVNGGEKSYLREGARQIQLHFHLTIDYMAFEMKRGYMATSSNCDRGWEEGNKKNGVIRVSGWA